MKSYLLIALMMTATQGVAAQKAQYLIRDGTQKTLGYQIGEKAFHGCNGSRLVIGDGDKVVDAPGQTCAELPTPVLANAYVVRFDPVARKIVVEIDGFKNTLAVDEKLLREMRGSKPNDGIKVLAVGGIPAALVSREK